MTVGAEQYAIDSWVSGRLTAIDWSPYAPLYNGLETRVFDRYAPSDTPFPYIVFQDQSPVRDVRGVGVTRVLVDTLYIVKVIAQVNDYSLLADIAKEMDAAMTVAVEQPIAQGEILTSVRQEGFGLVEVEDARQYRHFGGLYRIQASINS